MLEFKEDYYAILEVDRNADESTIKRAYREKSRYYHPDFENVPKNVSEAMMKLLNEASDILLNAEKKKSYDAFWDATFKAQRETTNSKQGSPLARPEDVEIKDYYNALNINRNIADESTIRNAYLAVLNQFKPQLQGENSQMAKHIIACAEEAYGVLSHKETKALYDSQYDKVFLAKISETPRVHGEITVVRPKTIDPTVYAKKEVTTSPRQDYRLSNIQGTRREVTTYRTTAPIVEKQDDHNSVVVPYKDKNKLISMINSCLLGMKLSMPSAQSRKIYIGNLYALLSEDHSFHFVEEKRYADYDSKKGYFTLFSIPGQVALGTYESSKLTCTPPWQRQEIITLRGVKTIAIPAIKLLPIRLISVGGFFDDFQDYIRYNDLCDVHEEILSSLNQDPNIIDSFFGKNKGKTM